MIEVKLKRGSKFYHAHWLADGSETNSGKPERMRCEVTRVAQGVVYWREVIAVTFGDGSKQDRFAGKPMYFEIDHAARYVGEVVEGEWPQ